MFEQWREKQRARKLERAISRLEDEAHAYERWSFADIPSRRKARKESIYRWIREIEELGGDALAVLPWRCDFLAEEAMPEVFDRVPPTDGSNAWKTVRMDVV